MGISESSFKSPSRNSSRSSLGNFFRKLFKNHPRSFLEIPPQLSTIFSEYFLVLGYLEEFLEESIQEFLTKFFQKLENSLRTSFFIITSESSFGSFLGNEFFGNFLQELFRNFVQILFRKFFEQLVGDTFRKLSGKFC